MKPAKPARMQGKEIKGPAIHAQSLLPARGPDQWMALVLLVVCTMTAGLDDRDHLFRGSNKHQSIQPGRSLYNLDFKSKNGIHFTPAKTKNNTHKYMYKYSVKAQNATKDRATIKNTGPSATLM
jgi:hypothetical protein